MTATHIKHILILSFLVFGGLNLNAQCSIHPNFRSIANMKGLNAPYELQFTIVETRLNGMQYTMKGAKEVCKRTFEKDCTKDVSFSMQLFNSDAAVKKCQIKIDFVKNSLSRQEQGKVKTYPNIQRRGNSFYVTGLDGTILTFSFVKNPLCLY